MSPNNVFPNEALDALDDIDSSVGDGALFGFIVQTDYDFLNSVTLVADGEVKGKLRAPGGGKVTGQAKSSGQYSLKVEWLDDSDNVVRREGIASNREGGTWSNFSLDPKGPFVDIVIVEQSSSEQTASMTAHYK